MFVAEESRNRSNPRLREEEERISSEDSGRQSHIYKCEARWCGLAVSRRNSKTRSAQQTLHKQHVVWKVHLLYEKNYVIPRAGNLTEEETSVGMFDFPNRRMNTGPITVAARSRVRTLESWVRIPLKVWMSVWVYSVFVLFCVWLAALWRAHPRPRGPTDSVKILRNWKSGQDQKGVRSLMNECINAGRMLKHKYSKFIQQYKGLRH
jgi:hypothetical protein